MKKLGKWMVVFVALFSTMVVITGCNCEDKGAEATGDQPAATNQTPAPPKDHPAH